MTKRRDGIFLLGGRGARVPRAALLLTVAAIASGGCSGMKQTIDGWFGEEPASSAAPREGQTYYAAVEGLALYAEASNSSKLVGRLAQYEKVTRSRTERGYAFVRSDESGLEGWVDNALLVWRIPRRENAPAKAPAAGSAADAAAAGAPDSIGAPAAEPTPTSTPAGATPAREEAPAQAPAAPPTPSPPSPSMFDPF